MRELTRNPYIVCFTASLFFFYEFFQTSLFNSLDIELMQSFQLDNERLSWLSSSYLYGVSCLLFPAGILLDYFSARKIILLTMVASIFGTVLFSLTNSWEQAAIGRFIVGITAGPFAFLGVLRFASRWFSGTRIALMSGLIISTGMLGGMLAQTPFVYLCHYLGWREALWINVIVGMFILALMFVILRDFPKGKADYYKQQKLSLHLLGLYLNVKQVVMNIVNWHTGLVAALVNLPVFILGTLYADLYLTQSYQLTKIEASNISMFLYAGMIFGAPIFGLLSDKIKQRKLPFMAGTFLCLMAILGLLEIQQPNTFLFSLIFFLLGIGCSSHVLAYPIVAENNPPALLGTATGLAGTLIVGAGALSQPLFAKLILHHWNGQMIDEMSVFTRGNYHDALQTLPLCLSIAFLGIYLLKESFGEYQNRRFCSQLKKTFF